MAPINEQIKSVFAIIDLTNTIINLIVADQAFCLQNFPLFTCIQIDTLPNPPRIGDRYDPNTGQFIESHVVPEVSIATRIDSIEAQLSIINERLGI